MSEENASVTVKKKDFDKFLESMSMDKDDFIEYTKSAGKTVFEKLMNVIKAYEDFTNLYKEINPYTAAMLDCGVVFGVRFFGDKICLGINGDPENCKQVLQDAIVNILGTNFKEKNYEEKTYESAED